MIDVDQNVKRLLISQALATFHRSRSHQDPWAHRFCQVRTDPEFGNTGV